MKKIVTLTIAFFLLFAFVANAQNPFTTAEMSEIGKFLKANEKGYYGNVKLVDEKGDTLLHRATAEKGVIAKNCFVVVKYLVSSGANVNARNKNGSTPLHNAANKGNAGVIKFLVDQKANVNAKDTKGVTPLHLAAGEGNLALVKFLVGKGADVNAESERGTPMDLAVRSGVAKKNMDVALFLNSQGAEVTKPSGGGGNAVASTPSQQRREHTEIPCRTCRGAGREKCTSCNGTGVRTCDCSASSRKDCRNCKGTGLRACNSGIYIGGGVSMSNCLGGTITCSTCYGKRTEMP